MDMSVRGEEQQNNSSNTERIGLKDGSGAAVMYGLEIVIPPKGEDTKINPVC